MNAKSGRRTVRKDLRVLIDDTAEREDEALELDKIPEERLGIVPQRRLFERFDPVLQRLDHAFVVLEELLQDDGQHVCGIQTHQLRVLARPTLDVLRERQRALVDTKQEVAADHEVELARHNLKALRVDARHCRRDEEVVAVGVDLWPLPGRYRGLQRPPIDGEPFSEPFQITHRKL